MKILRIIVICMICLIIGYTLFARTEDYEHQKRLYIDGIKYVCEIGPDGKKINNSRDLKTDSFLKSQEQEVNSWWQINSTFDSTQLYNLTVTSDSEMTMLWIFQPHGDVKFIPEDTREYNISLPPDTYEFFTYFRLSKHHFRFIYKKDIVLASDTTVTLSSDEAIYTSKLMFFREDYEPLRINSLGFRFILEPATLLGVGLVHLKLDSTVFLFQYNDLPDYFHNSWLIKGKQDYNSDNIYLINNYLKESAIDTIISNDPLNFSHADIIYHFPDSLETTHPRTQVGTTAPSYHYYPNDRDYNIPFQFRIYQDTSADFSLAQSRFSQTINVTSVIGTEIKTSEMRIGTLKVYGYPSPGEYSEPVILSENRTLHLGLPPTFWAGRFKNEDDTIKIGFDFGYRNVQQLFLSQTNDAINQPHTALTIHNEEEVVLNKTIYPMHKDEVAFFGYIPTDLTFKVPVNQNYTVSISNNHSEVAKHPARSVVIASFDLNRADKNPPYLRSFQILSDLQVSNVLDNDKSNIIRFIAKDDQELSNVKLFYSRHEDSLWFKMPLENNSPYYQSELPELETGYYSLKIYLSDSSQNWIENIMEPAFHVGEITTIENYDSDIKTSSLQISQGYPNPFNATVNFEYSTPTNYTGNTDISIYDILGKKVCALYSGIKEPGIHRISWKGKDSNSRSVSSGLYFIILKGGGFQIIRKILLVR